MSKRKEVEQTPKFVMSDRNGAMGTANAVNYLLDRAPEPTYTDRVELYRRQLRRSNQRQKSPYPVNPRASRVRLEHKLMRYAARAGFNFNHYFNSEVFNEQDLLIGWAGKKRKDDMRASRRSGKVKKTPPVRRVTHKGPIHLFILSDKLIGWKCVPVEPIEPLHIANLDRVILIMSGKQGSIQLIDKNQNTVKSIAWKHDETANSKDLAEQWSLITIPRSRNDGSKPLFVRSRRAVPAPKQDSVQ